MKVGIVITVLNNFRGAVETIHSIKTDHEHELIIMDQWRHNVPLSQAWNDGAEKAFNNGCDLALVCNDDILFAPQTIDNMVGEYWRLHLDEKVVMVTPNNIILEVADPYEILDYKLEKPDSGWSFSEHPNFSCFLIGDDFFEQVGKFDENFVPAWYEDNDMHRRINLLGYKAICTVAAPQIHFGGVTTLLMENPDSSRSREYYIKKWGGIPWPANEIYTTPYNNPALTPKDWIENYA